MEVIQLIRLLRHKIILFFRRSTILIYTRLSISTYFTASIDFVKLKRCFVTFVLIFEILFLSFIILVMTFFYHLLTSSPYKWNFSFLQFWLIFFFSLSNFFCLIIFYCIRNFRGAIRTSNC